MTGTITPNLTDISLCEAATGWSLGTADVDSFIQGAACITYTYATAGDKAAILFTSPSN